MRGRWILFVIFRVTMLVAQMASPAYGFTVDARRLGMGGTVVPGCQELLALNGAYHSVPLRPGTAGIVIPLPLGLVQLAQDFPTVNPADENFSVTRLANLALNPPFYVELGRPAALEGDISLSIARNEFAIDFEDAEALLPQKPFQVGGTWSIPLAGVRMHHLRTYLSPLLYLEGELAFDDALYDVLAHGVPLQPHSTYLLNAEGESLGGLSLHSGWTAPLRTDALGNGIYVGAFAKYIFGVGMTQATSQLAMTTADTIFGALNSLDTDYTARARYSDFGQVGNGFGFDLGIGYRAGPLDLGLGVRDLLTHVYWSRTVVWEAALDDSGNVQSETLSRDEPYTQKLPTQATLNASWSLQRTLLAADVVTSRLGTLLHLGVERRAGPLALRGGVQTDYDHRLQVSGGLGIGSPHWSFDVALLTHNRTFTGERGLMLGTSIALR
jgi:hypothetical protein